MKMTRLNLLMPVLGILLLASATSCQKPASETEARPTATQQSPTLLGSSHVLELAELNTDQIRAIDQDRTVVVIPITILEEHGPYLPSYSDGYATERLTRELADAIAARPGWTALLFPPIPLGNGGANEIGQKWIFPGSYTVRATTIRAVLMDLATELGEQGFRWVFLVTSHGAPNHHKALDQASEYFRDQYGGHMVNLFGLMPVFEARSAVEVPTAHAAEDGFSVHGGLWETSDVLFHRPDLVAPSYSKARSLTGRDMADLVRLAQEDDWPGYFGAPRMASVSLGARAWRHFSEKVCSTALEILDGADYQAIPRYGEVADQDPAALSVDQEDTAQDERVAEQQRQWLRRKGLQASRQGYVLKVGGGEMAAGAIIKASPKTGTQGGVVMIEPFPEDFSTGLHYHVEADEFFYTISGRGTAHFGGQDHRIEAGDVVFIPAGEDHKLFTDGAMMELLVFLDRPGLEEEFRAWHRAYGDAQPVSLEQLNEIAVRYGTVYKTLK